MPLSELVESAAGDDRIARDAQAAADLEKAQFSSFASNAAVKAALATGASEGHESDKEPQPLPAEVYPELLQNAIDNPIGSLYQSDESDLYTSLPHLPIERPPSDASDGGKEGDIEAQQGEGAGEKTSSLKSRRRSSIREEASKWKSLETWRQWSISMWSEFLGTFLLIFIGTAHHHQLEQSSRCVSNPVTLDNTGCGIVVKGESTAVVALGFFLAVVIVVEAFVPFSGAHFNPVISIVMCLCQVISVSLMLLHIAVQFVAGIVAAYMMKALIPGTSAADCAVTKVASEWQDGIGTLCPDPSISSW
jgi:hypothetical protein